MKRDAALTLAAGPEAPEASGAFEDGACEQGLQHHLLREGFGGQFVLLGLMAAQHLVLGERRCCAK